MNKYCVYMLASKKNGTLYVGVTSNLPKRVWEHKSKETEGFSQKYNVGTLVWYEVHENIEQAIKREKRLKTKEVQARSQNKTDRKR